MRIVRGLVILLVGGLLLAPVVEVREEAQAEPEEPVGLRLGWQSQSPTQGQVVEVLKRTNLLEGEIVVTTIPFSDSTPQAEAALAGVVDAIFADDQTVANLLSRTSRWTIVGRLAHGRVGIVVPPGSPARSVADLRGQVVAVPFGSTAHRALTEQEAAAGLRPGDDVENRDLDIVHIQSLVLAGGRSGWGPVAAVAVEDPLMSQLQADGLARPLTESPMLTVVAMSDSFLGEQPERSRQFVEAMLEARAYVARRGAQVRSWYLDDSEFVYEPEVLEADARRDRNDDATAPVEVDLEVTGPDLGILEQAAAWSRAQGYTTNEVDIRGAVDPRYLADAKRAIAAGDEQEVRVRRSWSGTGPNELVELYFFDDIPLWLLMLFSAGCSFGAILFGQLLGERRKAKEKTEPERPVTSAVGAVLALLAFLVALTFTDASDRYDQRKLGLLKEVEAIETAYLRATLLPEPERVQAQGMLRDYVGTRLFMQEALSEPEALGIVQLRTRTLQKTLWASAEALMKRFPDVRRYQLYAESLNRVFEAHTQRIVLGSRFRVQLPVWIALWLVALLSMFAVGFLFGQRGKSTLIAGGVLAMSFAIVIALILDLDRPGPGLIKVSQGAMVELYRNMEARQQEPPVPDIFLSEPWSPFAGDAFDEVPVGSP